MFERTKSIHQPHRRGLVYSLSLFFMLAALLSLGALWLMQSERNMTTWQTTSDAEVLSMRMDELKWLCTQSMGINVSAGRNQTRRWINVSDSFPFATTSPSADRVFIRGLGYLVNGTGSPNVRGNWSNLTNVNVSKFDITRTVVGGLVLNSTSATSYTQDNSDANSDAAMLYQGTTNPREYAVSIVCSAPSPATQLAYVDPVAAGTGTYRTIKFASVGAVGGTHSVARAEFDSDVDQLFEARYYDGEATPNWITSIHADWLSATTSLKMWSEFNTTYTDTSKANVTCNFNLSMSHSDNGALAHEIHIPIDVEVRYGNATYSGNLSMVRE